MKKIALFLTICLLAGAANSQRFHVGIFGGLANYNGDLTDKYYPSKTTNGAIGITGNYEVTNHFRLRAGYTYAVVGGADRFAKDPEAVARNLSFETTLHEFSVVGELYLFDLGERRFSPYAFGGLAMYKYNPYAYDANLNKVYLKPLSTEGQGMQGYPDKKPYNLTQVAIPFGLGVKYAFNDNLQLAFEIGYRKLFTDYLDDVSGTYADPADLLAQRGQLAVDMSYRGDELPGGNPGYPAKGFGRGGAEFKDAYYFTGLHLTYRLGNGNGGFGGGGGRRNRMGCPANVY